MKRYGSKERIKIVEFQDQLFIKQNAANSTKLSTVEEAKYLIPKNEDIISMSTEITNEIAVIKMESTDELRKTGEVNLVLEEDEWKINHLDWGGLTRL